MGTRNLIIVKLNKKIRIAQYCQWDGYFTGQGKDIARFLKHLKLAQFKKNLEKTTWITPEESKKYWVECGAGLNNEFVNEKVADKFKKKYPELHRDTGAGILDLIQNGKVTKLENSCNFKKDKIHCEYVYEIDMDTKTVQTWDHGKKLKPIPFKYFTATNMDRLSKGEDILPCNSIKFIKGEK